MRSIRWACVVSILASGFLCAKGCANAGADLSKRTVVSTPDGKTVTTDEKADVRFPKNMDSLSGFRFSLGSVEIGSMSNFKIEAHGIFLLCLGFALIIIGGVLATGTIPYVSAITGAMPVPGLICIGVGVLALVWNTIQGAVSVIVVLAIAGAAVVAIAYAYGKYLNARSTAVRGEVAKEKLDAEGKADEGTAALRAANLGIDKAFADAAKIKATLGSK